MHTLLDISSLTVGNGFKCLFKRRRSGFLAQENPFCSFCINPADKQTREKNITSLVEENFTLWLYTFHLPFFLIDRHKLHLGAQHRFWIWIYKLYTAYILNDFSVRLWMLFHKSQYLTHKIKEDLKGSVWESESVFLPQAAVSFNDLWWL